MSIPQPLRAICTQELTALYDRRVPPSFRDRIQLEYVFRRNHVVLFERRPPWDGSRRKWSKSKIARFEYHPKSDSWSLYCPDRNDKWHSYEGFEQVQTFQELVAEMDSDPTGIFWG